MPFEPIDLEDNRNRGTFLIPPHRFTRPEDFGLGAIPDRSGDKRMLDSVAAFHGQKSYCFPLNMQGLTADPEEVEHAGLRYEERGLKAFFRSEEANKVTLSKWAAGEDRDPGAPTVP